MPTRTVIASASHSDIRITGCRWRIPWCRVVVRSAPARPRLELGLDPLEAEDILAGALLQHSRDETNFAHDARDDHLLQGVDAAGGLLDLLPDLLQLDLGRRDV